MQSDAERPCSLYRHFDADGKLLYVGISISTFRRLSEHDLYSDWFGRAATMTREVFSSRESAQAAEREAIRSERPEFNKMFGVPATPTPPSDGGMLPEGLRALRKGAGKTQSELADAIGMSRKAIVEMEKGRAPIEKRTELAVRYVVEKL